MFASYDHYRQIAMGLHNHKISAPQYSVTKRPKKCSYSPKEVFYGKVKGSKDFQMLKGYSELSLKTNTSNWEEEGLYSWIRVKHKQRRFPSDFYKYKDKKTGSGAIIEMPEDYGDMCRIVLKLLWVPEESSRKGIARRCLQRLLDITLEVDELAKATGEWKGDAGTLEVCGSHCSVSLCPNPFKVEDWTLDQRKNSIDWSNPDAPCKTMADESYKEMKAGRRLDWKALRDFYKSLGFVECEDLSEETFWDEEQRRIRTRRLLLGRSIALGRKAMLFPAENTEYEIEEEI